MRYFFFPQKDKPYQFADFFVITNGFSNMVPAVVFEK